MAIQYTAPSGAKVEITLSSYAIAFELFRAVLKAAREGGVASKLPDKFDMESFQDMDIKNFGGLADAFIDILASKEVEDLLFQCFQRCTYDDGAKERITRETFEKETRRGDFIPVAWEVGSANIRPFLSHLPSLLKNAPLPGTNASPQ